ncbi:hypothetical protein [Frigoribacterium sp. PhB24]|uniref:hypothetical protein n=1 Tax=Frigoribacterium sp. PhB24 TaxID=2485204 RepID=UPI000F4872C4|nr:hypothetical protein [Frigoribacterium sp. PhB24]
MESHSNDNSSKPVDPVAALRVANEAQARMAERVRSPWWVHVLRGAFVAAAVYGLGAPDSSAWMLVGVLGLVALSRRRVRDVGVARANPERWRFLTLGAPWAIVALAVSVAAMAFVVVAQDEPLWQVGVAAGVAGVVTLALGPAADASARRRLGSVLAGSPAR